MRSYSIVSSPPDPAFVYSWLSTSVSIDSIGELPERLGKLCRLLLEKLQCSMPAIRLKITGRHV